MTSEVPLVSVVMPVYNAGPSLQRTLDALAAQTHPRCEFLCVNDGSTDDSLTVLQAQAARDPRFRVIDQGNAGAYRARFTGIDAAQGDYLAFCDAGDLPAPTMVERLVKEAEKTDADLSVCAYRRASLGGHEKARPEMTAFCTGARAATPESGWLVTVNTALWNKLYRRDLVASLEPLPDPPRVAEDALFLLELYPHVGTVAFTEEPLYDYVVEEGSAMQQVSAEDFGQTVEAWREVRRRLAAKSPAYLELFDLAAFVHLGISLPTRMGGCLPYRDIRTTVDREFPQQRCTSLLSRESLRKHPGLRTAAFAHGLYRAGLMTPALGAYNLLNRLSPSEIKW
ncbi:glycosyltransferase [Olsenella sp. YH-ols2217]|uniref:Glycosyltransferase n=1 Tax=Kribbibacterium absianum TaxID=3044210 RepID=A0ABT6ZM92_9ACTN|nr:MULTISPECIES: glycosyltransferase [unclassified Olsenella]MDJ1122157.1 glycosyltransferase [Olsenella sp. YH-ols2216]MDJ1130165.1 glycosyltransferase [Olsenella sp. YH-ols2217]